MTELVKKCRTCGEMFSKPKTCSLPIWFGNDRRPEGVKYCSIPCSAKSRQGKPAHNRGKKGKPWAEGRRQAIVNAAKQRRATRLVVNSKGFSGGYWNAIRQDVLERDQHICQKCGYSEPEIMTVDHIKPKSIAPELMYQIDNCVTLCPNCHARKTIADKKLIRLVTTIANA